MSKTELKKVWLLFHRYVGLSVGLFIVVLGISGSAATLWNEYTQLVDPRFRIEEPGTAYAPLQRVMESLHAAHPNRPNGWSVDYPYPENRHAPAWAVYEEPEEKAGVHESPLYVGINPYTAGIMGEFYWGETPISWLFNVHSILGIQSSDIGESLVGVIGIVFLLMALSGICLWWPAGIFTARKFFTSPRLAGPGFEFDLHRVIGFYSSIFFLVACVTGIIMIWPVQSARIAGVLQPVNVPLIDQYETVYATPVPGATPVPFDTVLDRARELFPEAEFRHAYMPAPGSTEAYGVTLRQPEERFDRMYPETRVWLDQYSGNVIKVVDAKEFNLSRSVLGYNRYSFHNGAAFGDAGRFVMFVVGLIPLFLFVTGIRQWLRLRRRSGGRAAG
jgi:uncharacterized iron-regulated membrane protein